jgi:hypothetical protein
MDAKENNLNNKKMKRLRKRKSNVDAQIID